MIFAPEASASLGQLQNNHPFLHCHHPASRKHLEAHITVSSKKLLQCRLCRLMISEQHLASFAAASAARRALHGGWFLFYEPSNSNLDAFRNALQCSTAPDMQSYHYTCCFVVSIPFPPPVVAYVAAVAIVKGSTFDAAISPETSLNQERQDVHP